MSEEHGFIVSLELLREKKDRGALAKLKRGIGKTMGDVEMYPYVVPFLPNEYTNKHHLYFLIGSLFGLYSDAPSVRNQSMGSVFSQLGNRDSDSLQKRFKALLNAEEKDLHYHLRQAVSLAKSRRVPIDYHRLFKDLFGWTHPEKYVQLQWAKDYWTKKQ
jgi:CRISPR system Cascade subunit CasB